MTVSRFKTARLFRQALDCGRIMSWRGLSIMLWIAAFVLPSFLYCRGGQSPQDGVRTVALPPPRTNGPVSVEEALQQRRSIRSFVDEPLSLQDLSQLLWAAQGITSGEGFRTAPSAGALHPLEIYVVADHVEELAPGIYRYVPRGHAVSRIRPGDVGDSLSSAALEQSQIAEAAVNIIIAAVWERTIAKYGERGIRYVHMETGHAAQNLLLQAQSLGLGACPIGAFEEDRVKALLGLAPGEDPLYVISVGRTE